MKYFSVSYERKPGKASYWTYATEIIQARGLMHAHKLAHDHLKALKKLESLPMRIDKIREIPPPGEEEQ